MTTPTADDDHRSLFGDTYVKTAEDWKQLTTQAPPPRRVPLGFNARCTTPRIDVASAGPTCSVDVNLRQISLRRWRRPWTVWAEAGQADPYDGAETPQTMQYAPDGSETAAEHFDPSDDISGGTARLRPRALLSAPAITQNGGLTR